VTKQHWVYLTAREVAKEAAKEATKEAIQEIRIELSASIHGVPHLISLAILSIVAVRSFAVQYSNLRKPPSP
jgi:hypothetical protein